jgi:outer membrane protein assembly factor BamB
VITMTQDNLVGVAAADGSLLWKRPYSVRATRNAVTPIVHNQILIVSGLGMPVSGLRVFNKSGQWATEDVWVNNDTTMDMSTGVVIGNSLYGFSPRNSGQFFAIDANTGQTLWLSEPRPWFAPATGGSRSRPTRSWWWRAPIPGSSRW